ncbi:uncharacterized protein PHALS_14098 [Plasmopara halstedii]|uniref:Uncharacterized protein n=1 Tax=Plasmopara halstedii TaxID=4781 RepID=A0A0P1AQG3_PLAHL|nr:uncharacterized protein PHALS_14098 [Plasmopara halstedii]CEG43807.1 hypothetical protein PHALS_14098 [Plasmopara halstedii]|eukprot:XP_024580176.1 hypothetical protein PHALS_14098 [Plasmopara halstedii]
MVRKERQQMLAHLQSAFAEIERMTVVYSDAIKQLKNYIQPNLTTQSAVEWFNMYLRVVDIGIHIRRGEIRHRTVQQFTYPCMHKTGIEGAVHTGLGIDDGNAILQLMEERKVIKESMLDEWFRRMDILDRDVVGLADKGVSQCLENFQRQSSVFYDRVDVTGEDPFQKMLLLRDSNGPATILAKVARRCFGPKNCYCEIDAEPWTTFCLKSGSPHVNNPFTIGAAETAEPGRVEDVNVVDIKRRMGFESLTHEEKRQALTHDTSELARRNFIRGQTISCVVGGQIAPLSARSIYQKMCQGKSIILKQHISALLDVKNGSHYLILSSIGFYSAEDLQILVDIFSTPGLPPVKELDVSCGFFNAAAFQVICKLLQVQLLRQSIERLSLRGIAVPMRADVPALMRILIGESSSSLDSLPALTQLKTLDISFNTLWFEGAALLRSLLCSLRSLEELSLESCFPELSSLLDVSFTSNDQDAIKESVRCALADASTRLLRLNFGSNAIEKRWLDALFTPESTLQKFDLYRMSSPAIMSASRTDSTEVEAYDVWKLQNVITMNWSSSSDVHSKKLLGVLSDELRGGFARILHLDVAVTVTGEHEAGNQMDKLVAQAITSISDYAALRSCRLKYYSCSAIFHGMALSMATLLESGLHECETLSVHMPQLYLTGHAIGELLSNTNFHRMEKMMLVVGLISDASQVHPDYKYCFLNMKNVRELILECHVLIENQSTAYEDVRAYFSAFARSLELSWLALGSSDSDVSEHDQTALNHRNGKLTRHFILSERHHPKTWVYHCRFAANE